MAWTDERVETLKKLWADGLSASAIANRLGGVSRNSVISKVHRLGLSTRVTTQRLAQSHGGKRAAKRVRARQKAAKAAQKPQTALQAVFAAEPFVPAEDLVIPVAERKTLLDLEANDCRWPIGDPKDPDFHFCGKGKVNGLVYCDFHVRRAYQPPKPTTRPSGPHANPLRIVAGTDVDGGGGEGSRQGEMPASGDPTRKLETTE